MLSVVLLLLLLSIIVTVHEFGHFLAGRLFNVYISEFSIGMGKSIYQKKGKETTFSIRMLPFGGYCAFAGQTDDKIETVSEEVDINEIPPERCLNNLSAVKKIIVYSAGVIMNFLLAFVIISMLYLGVGRAPVSADATIISVSENYPAAEAGLMPGDKIIHMSLENGYSSSIDSYSEVSNFLSMYDGNGNVTFTIIRGDEKLNINVKPVEEDDYYIFGISFDSYSYVETNILNCWKYGFIYIKEVMLILITTVIGLFRGVGYENVSGVVGMYEVTEQAVSYGFATYMSLIALISLNVGVMNLVPLPLFDGGRILITLIELIIGKPLDKKFEEAIMNISLAIVFGLFIYVTIKDVIKLF